MATKKHILFIDVDNKNDLVYSKNYVNRNVDIEGGNMYDDNNILIQINEEGYITITDKDEDVSVYIGKEFLNEFSRAVDIALGARNDNSDMELINSLSGDK